MDPWMLHMLPARGRPYNSGSAYILDLSCLLCIPAIASLIAIVCFTASESPSNKFVFKSFVLDDYLQAVHN